MSISKEECYTYFDCKELECIRRQDLSRQCWEFDDVQCKSHSKAFEEIRKKFENKLEACKLCLYYQDNN